MAKRSSSKRDNKPRNVKPKKRDFIPPQLRPLNYSQERYMTAIDHDDVVISYGSAGTGKTFIMAAKAADALITGDIDKVILTRPNVSCGDEMGHLPGDLDEKFEPWLHPFINAMKTRMSAGAMECAMKHKNIESVPLQLMRGGSYDNCYILLDEGQNTTIEQMKMITTRIGYNCKLLINGDTKQTDLPKDSGLKWLIENIKRHNMPIELIEFNIDDCVRSETCKMFLTLYEKV